MGEEGCCVLVGWGIEFEGLDEGIGTEVGFSEEEHSMHQYFMGRGGLTRVDFRRGFWFLVNVYG
jgi:hypothetical protein